MTIAAIGGDVSQVNDLQAKAKVAPQSVLGAIQRASTRTGVDFAYLVKKAETESSLNPTAQAKGSSARGLYQFIDSTWLNMLDKHGDEVGRSDLASAITHKANGTLSVADPAKRREIMALRDDPELSATMAAELASDNAETIKAKTGQSQVSGTDLYLAHFLGAGGATSLLSKLKDCPNAPACNVVPEAAAANRNVFYTAGGRAKSVQEVYQHFAGTFGNGKVNMTAGADDSDAVTQAQGAAMAMLQDSKVGSFGALAASDDSLPSSGLSLGTASSDSAASYTPVALSNLSADGSIYSFAPKMAEHNSLYYQLMLMDQKQKSERL